MRVPHGVATLGRRAERNERFGNGVLQLALGGLYETSRRVAERTGVNPGHTRHLGASEHHRCGKQRNRECQKVEERCTKSSPGGFRSWRPTFVEHGQPTSTSGFWRSEGVRRNWCAIL